MFKSLFSKDKPAPPPEILGMTIGRDVTLDRVEMTMLPEDTLIDPPEGTLLIVAQGHCDLGEQSHMHRFYPDDDRFLLQVQGGDGVTDPRIDEVMLWYVWHVTYPSSDADWREIETAIRQTRFTLEGSEGDLVYDRAWFDDSDRPEDPVTYWESVREDRERADTRRIFQTAMLFARELSDGRDEMLLVNMEEPEGGDRAVSYLIGRPMPQHSITT